MIPFPKVSVACAWYNRADYIRDTLDSLLAQDYPNFDITLVNDGSPDPRVKTILDSYTDPRLRVIHQQNTGFTRAIRRAIEESDGEYIAIQGAGDISLPGRLSAQVAYLEKRPQVVAVGTGHFIKEPTQRRSKFEPAIEKINKETLRRRTPFTQGTVMYRRKIWNDSGGYDAFFVFCQDWEYYTRLIEYGEIHGIKEAFYIKFMFPDGASVEPSKKVKQYCYAKVASGSAKRQDYFQATVEGERPYLSWQDQVILSAKIVLSTFMRKNYKTSLTWASYLFRLLKEGKSSDKEGFL
jgi:glycosyltransferase involved in cell wall biosynthesis